MTKSLRATLCGLPGGPGAVAGAQDRVAAQRDLHPVGVDQQVAAGRLLAVADRLLQHRHHPLVALDDGGGVAGVGRVHAGEQVAQRVQHHVGLAERREHLADVAQEGGVRADDEDAAAVEGAAVRVEQVGGAVQRGDRLAGAGAALDDEDAGQLGADHPVLLGLDGRDHVGHPAGPRGADRGDQRGLARQGRPVAVGELVEVEDLVVDPGDLAQPGVDVAPADQADRIARRGRVEGPGGGGAPVDQLELVIVVAQADPANVKGEPLLVVEPAEAQAALGQVELGEAPFVLGRRNVALQPGLMGAAEAAAGADRGQFLLAALSCLVKQAVEHRHVLLLGAQRRRVPGGARVLLAIRVIRAFRGAFGRAFRGVFHRVWHKAFDRAFRDRRLGIRLTHCHNAWYTPEYPAQAGFAFRSSASTASFPSGRIIKPTTSAHLHSAPRLSAAFPRQLPADRRGPASRGHPSALRPCPRLDLRRRPRMTAVRWEGADYG